MRCRVQNEERAVFPEQDPDLFSEPLPDTFLHSYEFAILPLYCAFGELRSERAAFPQMFLLTLDTPIKIDSVSGKLNYSL
jgi:hypothetical protein